ncbi:hypothetical protein [Salinibacillus kushneri]|uniref:hypothetical protein n=1 Tax=Salinibacillus kushneri TaxID=237682 RepID=UPI000B80C212|nr:hypothetical protein [Salinibacillus kushneri]
MREVRFVELQKKLFYHFEKGDFERSLEIIQTAHSEFPDRIDKTSFWKCCLLSVQGDLEGAVAELQYALNKNYWWNPQLLLQYPDLKPLYHHRSFKNIVEECQCILEREREKEKASAKIMTIGNTKATSKLLILHWRGSNIKDFSPFWLERDDITHYSFTFLQSSQLFGYNSYCWDDSAIARCDLQQSIEKMDHNENPVIIGGASQGAALAIEHALLQELYTFKGFIAVVPAIKDINRFEDILKNQRPNNMKGFIITGKKDHYVEATKKFCSLLERYHLPFKLVEIKGLGHFFPDNFQSLLREAIEYISKE